MPAALVLNTPQVDLTEAGDTFQTLAGVEAELHVFEAMPHGGFGGDSPEDREAAAEQRLFLDKHGA